jgi:serine/threonine protein phosphatase PrpC
MRNDLYLGQDMVAAEMLDTGHGRACVFTRSSPDKNTGNEDAVGVISCGESGVVIIVADGLGGLPAGQQASVEAVKQLSAVLNERASCETPLREAILNGIEESNTAIIAQGMGAATTLAVVEIEGRELRSYHAGDSVILVTGQRGKIKYQSISHSPVGYAVEAGLVQENDAIYHEDRHLVSNMIGTSDMRVEIGPRLTLAMKDTVVVASDGLFDNLQIEEIVDTVRAGRLDRAAARLVAHCQERMRAPSDGTPHKPDDLSFVLFRLG